MKSLCNITLIIPVYKEEHNIVPFVEEVAQKVKHKYKAIIIYDHEDDSTLNKMSEILSRYDNIIFQQNIFGTGVINAFKTGFYLAKTQYIVPIMADLSDMPETINIMVQKIEEGYDMVIASRYVKGGKKIGGPKIKNLLSKTANLTLHWLTGIPTHDITNAFVMYKKEILDQITIQSTGGFEITMELISKTYFLNYKLVEVPTINRDRISGKSKFKLFRWIKNYLYWYCYILFRSLGRKLQIAP